MLWLHHHLQNAPVALVSNKSDKSILSGASKVTAIGISDNSIIEQCLDAVKSNRVSLVK